MKTDDTFRLGIRTKWFRKLRLLVALLLATQPTLLLAVTPGPQFQVNTFTAGTQRDETIGMNATGEIRHCLDQRRPRRLRTKDLNSANAFTFRVVLA